MKVRPDSVFSSTLLHTIALLYFVRSILQTYFSADRKAWLEYLNESLEVQTLHDLGVACLAIVIVGLIVLWTGYVRRSRPAWFVMFAITWLWAFPVLVLPIAGPMFRGNSSFTFPELLCDAMLGPGIPRRVVELFLFFLLMVIGLILPVGRMFVARKANEPVHLPSRRFVVFAGIGAIVALTALGFWLRVGMVYEIPAAQMSGWLVAPPPPPPSPDASNCVDKE